MSQTRRHLTSALLPMALGFLVLLPFLRGHWRLGDDAYYSNLPAMLLQARTLAEGMWPLWNPNIGLGQPWALSPGSSSLYYPPQTLWGLLVGWTEFSYLGYVLLHLAMGGWLAAGFARRLGLGLEACLFFALAWCGNGFVLGFLSNPNLLVPWVYWPLLGIGLIGLHGPVSAHGDGWGRTWAVRAIGVSLFAIEVGGYPLLKAVILGSTAVVYWLATKKPGSWLKGPRWKPALTAAAAAAMASAPSWWTTFEALRLSDRLSGSIYDDSLYHNVFNFLQLATLVLPTQFLKRDEQQLGIMHLERSWWIGSLTLAMLLLAIRNRWATFGKNAGQYLPAAGVALAFLLFALGGNSFVRELTNAGAGVFEHLRHSHLARAPMMALLCFLGAAGFDALLRQTGNEKLAPGKRNPIAAAWYGYLLLALVLALSESSRQIDGRQVYLDPSSGWKAELLHSGFYLLLAYTAFMARTLLRPWVSLGTALLAIQFLSLADAGYAFRHLTGVRSDVPIKAVDESFRVASPLPNERVVKRWFDGQDWYSWEGNAKILHAYFPPNHSGIGQALKIPRAAELVGRLASCAERPEGPAGAAPGCSFRVDRWFGNVLELSGRSAGNSWLVAHDLVDPHWEATVNERPVPILPAYGLFKAVSVPAGEWRVRFEYRHGGLPVLLFVAFLGGLLLAFPPRRLIR